MLFGGNVHYPMKHHTCHIHYPMVVHCKMIFGNFMMFNNSIISHTGWWFGTIFIFSIYWECHHPNWRTYIFQRVRLNHQQSSPVNPHSVTIKHHQITIKHHEKPGIISHKNSPNFINFLWLESSCRCSTAAQPVRGLWSSNSVPREWSCTIGGAPVRERWVGAKKSNCLGSLGLLFYSYPVVGR